MSLISVLATAIPEEQASYAVASPSAFAEEMASSFEAGDYPAWYQALPSDVKELLPVAYPASVEATSTPAPTSTPSPTASASESEVTSSAYMAITTSVGTLSTVASAGHNSTVTDVHMPTLSGSATKSAPAVATANAATYPGAAMGAGVGAVLGFVGMLVL